jgi:hypothetical protein
MDWTERLKEYQKHERYFWSDGSWDKVARDTKGVICNDGMERVISAQFHARVGLVPAIRQELVKKVGRVMRFNGWEPTLLWIDGQPRRSYVKPTKRGAKLRKPGRPAGVKDAKPRQRRWAKRPAGMSRAEMIDSEPSAQRQSR